MGTQGAHLQDLDRNTLEVDGARGTGEVHDEVHLAVNFQVFRHVTLEVGESFAVQVVCEIYNPARNQVVDGDDLVTVGQQPVAEMGSQEARTTGYDNAHEPFLSG